MGKCVRKHVNRGINDNEDMSLLNRAVVEDHKNTTRKNKHITTIVTVNDKYSKFQYKN